ncbi:hypothetical protein GCM10009087_04930 [Sphingomonas oligophenolica]|uniref:Uncharacterized protein n=1 Tax=Sphingomonas oligophenolica TaxID=301154 RepID=A0ABU9YCK7_9SPHN
MTVASWEFHALAVMFIATHGDAAEEEAAIRLRAAEEEGDRGQMVVWTEIGLKLPIVRAAQAKTGG